MQKNSGFNENQKYIQYQYSSLHFIFSIQSLGTNFRDSIRRAFEILEESKTEQASSFCARTIMFLTDGQADFDSDDYAYVRDKASKLQVTQNLSPNLANLQSVFHFLKTLQTFRRKIINLILNTANLLRTCFEFLFEIAKHFC